MKVTKHLKEMLPVDEANDIRILQRGTILTTIGLNGERQPWRVWLSQCKSRILINHAGPKYSPGDYIEVMDIGEVRSGCRTDEFHSARQALGSTDKDGIKLFEDCSFSVHVGDDGSKIYSIMAEHPDDARRWVRVLTRLVRESQESIRQSVCDPRYWLRRIFREADVREKGYLSLEQCQDLLKSKLHVAMEEKRVEAFFHAANTNLEMHEAQQGLDEDEFFRFYQLTSHRPALDELFYDLIADDKIKTLSAEKLLEFLTEDQNVANLDLDKVLDIILKYDPNFDEIPLAMSLNGFRSMMVSDMFDIRKEEHRKTNQPMDRPLSHYWVKSSHNTYLLKDQLIGKSSIEGFCRAMVDNCACVELDLWDGPNGEPIIYHGRTLVTKILARHVLSDGILPFAFVKDNYPIILSIEDHLSDNQRQVFIRDFKNIIGDHVYVVDANNLTSLPSPDQLKRKIIIKASNAKWGQLANICQSVHFPSDALKKDAKQAPVTHISSLSEHQINRLLNPSLIERLMCNTKSARVRRQKLRELTARRQIRVYPGGHRQLSSNYSPIKAMNAGCQMAAMNIQTKCSNMAIYEGRFRANGDCGYALKPDFLIDPSAPRVGPKRIKIKIISGQNLPSGKPDSASSPYIKVRVDGEDCDKDERTTEKVNHNGLNPVWNTEMTFHVHEPELAIILFQAKQNNCLFGLNTSTFGSFALPVLSLASGYRHVPLQDKNMVRVPLATLFVKVTVEDI